jgi:hypothetical protein
MSAAHHKGLARKAVSSIVLVACLIALSPVRAAAWGEEGHQIVAGIAENYLKTHSPQALARAKQLLGGQSLVDVALFADDVRNKRTYTKNWHFVDIPLDEDSYVPARDCKATAKGDCAVQALIRFGFILANKNEDQCARAEALKFIVHLVGDIHQPLHNIDDDDAGGNGKIVRFFELQGFNGAPPNLHQVWDTGIIKHSGKSVAQITSSLSGSDDPNISLNPFVWVQDAHKLAQEAYARLPEPNADDVYVLDSNNAYYEAGLPVVGIQLKKAGLRLGKTLEKALG